jgi:hypothetical protein
MNKYLIPIALIILAIVTVFLIPKEEYLISDKIQLTVYTSNDNPTGKALVTIPFLKSTSRTNFDIIFDLNNDGNFSDDEQLVTGASLMPQKDWKTGAYFQTNLDLSKVTRAVVKYQDSQQEVAVAMKQSETGTLFDLQSVTNPNESMKGLVNTALADEPIVEITTENVPDLNQQPGECGPTAAANSLTSLITKHGQNPQAATDMINELKNDMKWTKANGVLPDDFVTGKNTWAKRHNIPVKTEKVGDQNGISTIDAIKQALQKGQAVELRLKLSSDGANAQGGHMVTVTGIHQGEGQTYLDINDPVTADSGTESVEVRGNVIVNYGEFNGIVGLSWGFTQSWDENNAQQQSRNMILNGVDFTNGQSVEVIDYEGSYLLVSSLRVGQSHPPHATGPGCGAQHWHADNSVTAVNNGKILSDPLAGGCGFGTLVERPIMMYFPHELLAD